MNKQRSRRELEQFTDALAEHLRERSAQQTIAEAERLRQIAQADNDPFTARLIEETLEDFSHLPDYTEALFRRRAERVLRPRRRLRDIIVGRARRVQQQILLPVRSKEEGK